MAAIEGASIIIDETWHATPPTKEEVGGGHVRWVPCKVVQLFPMQAYQKLFGSTDVSKQVYREDGLLGAYGGVDWLESSLPEPGVWWQTDHGSTVLHNMRTPPQMWYWRT